MFSATSAEFKLGALRIMMSFPHIPFPPHKVRKSGFATVGLVFPHLSFPCNVSPEQRHRTELINSAQRRHKYGNT